MEILIILFIGWILLTGLSLLKRFTFSQVLRLSLDGIKNAANVLLMLALVGIMTGLWRGSGTIAYIVSISMRLLQPGILLLCFFLLNAAISFLIGTSFGTAATMGVVCMIVANAAGLSPLLSGGAVMSGIFFGDRCSPVSSSAMLVADITGTNLYTNLKNLFRSAIIPFVLSCLFYLIAGFFGTAANETASLDGIFSQEFVLTPVLLLPAGFVLLLALFRVNTKVTLMVSSLVAFLLSLFIQNQPMQIAIRTVFEGYQAIDPQVGQLVNGGGLFSMWRVLGIVCLSSTYAGIIKGTGIADQLTTGLTRLANRIGANTCTVLVSIFSCMLACNQTLAIMMVNQFCSQLYPEKKEAFAVLLGDTVVVIAALVPWCIAGAVPIAAIGAPGTCLFAACYLYLLPIKTLIQPMFHSHKK